MTTYEMKHVSPSQIETWLGCRRQWYWEKVMGLVKPPSEGNITGSACHAIIEDVLLDRNDEDLSIKRDGKDRYRAIVRPALPTILRQRAQVRAGTAHVERNMKRKLRNGLDLIGRIDFIDFSNPDEPLVDDQKTTKDAVYIKAEEELRTNIQMLAYAYEAVCLKPLAKGVRVAHNVMLTRGPPKARYTETFIPVREVHAGWTRIQDIADEMRETARIASPADVPPTLTACDKYGGCFHRDRCAAIQAAKSGLPAPSPYDGISNTPSENTTMATTTPLDPSVMAKLLGSPAKPTNPALTPPTTALPPALAAAVRPAAPTLLPPESPTNPREAKAQAAQLAAAPVVEVVAQVDGADLLLSLGWSGEEVNALTDEMFALVVKERWERKVCEVGFAAPEADGFQAIDKVNPNATQIVAPAAPVRRSRVAVAPVAPVAMVPENASEVIAESQERAEAASQDRAPGWEERHLLGSTAAVSAPAEPPRRRGRPPGSPNKPKVTAEPAPAVLDLKHVEPMQPGEDPVVAALREETSEEAAAEEIAQVVAGEQAAGSHYIGGESTLVDEAVEALAHSNSLQENRIAELERALAKSGQQYDAMSALHDKALYERNQALNASPAARPTTYGEFVLYVDCLPETAGVAFRHLDAVLAPFMEKVAAGFKNEKTGAPEPLAHYALVPFARGPGLVAAHVLTNLASVTAPGILYVDTRSPCAAAVLEVLRPKADLIVSARGR